ncbi:uncharacterized protein JCM6883_006616 [Sporobolomyces salmoneus]|uniref:uncharacterized protein n=1 Tax=Sporobolomyces salmoneus TaxID=183962 RepID=UPI00316F1021
MHFSTAFSILSLVASTVSAKQHCHRRHHLNSGSSSSLSTSAAKQSNAAAVAVAAYKQDDSTGSDSSNNNDSWSSKSNGGSSSSWSSKTSSAANSVSTSSGSSSSSSSSSSSGSSKNYNLKGCQKNGIFVGFLPDDGSGGGSSQTIFEIESSIGQTSAAQGWYAQTHAGTLFDGSQFKWRKDQIVKAGVFQPAVMPLANWWGLTYKDNQQAVAICKVMKEYTDLGVEVWLRFAHEVNYYQKDGTYTGTVDDFKEGWDVVAKACRSIAPEVKMFFTPNVASLEEYQKFYPDDHSTVDLIGIDYYPKQTSGNSFVDIMKPFHDAYTSENGPHFAIGEIGLGVAADMSSRLAWFKDMTSAETKAAMPHYVAVSWFNYYKDNYSYKIAADSGDYVVKQYLA